MSVLGSGFKGQGSGSGVQGFGFWAQGLGPSQTPPKDPNSISLV